MMLALAFEFSEMLGADSPGSECWPATWGCALAPLVFSWGKESKTSIISNALSIFRHPPGRKWPISHIPTPLALSKDGSRCGTGSKPSGDSTWTYGCMYIYIYKSLDAGLAQTHASSWCSYYNYIYFIFQHSVVSAGHWMRFHNFSATNMPT